MMNLRFTRDTQTGKIYLPVLRRLKWRWVLWRNTNNELNRRASVEQYLWNCYHGKHETPDKEMCKQLACRLGIESKEK